MRNHECSALLVLRRNVERDFPAVLLAGNNLSLTQVCQKCVPSNMMSYQGISSLFQKKDEVVGIFILETQCLIGVLHSSFFLSPWTYNDHHQWLNKYVLHCLATLMYS